ncbi:HDOD domain-containing protein [Nocardioides marmoribigeumensis]|uniref:HD-like signal output (HDOD) protein n=1 Tax=Nocardioides marmoribigeumensis TaxID=433649 RepID=A0ABU2BWF9_9ACTN|nr:HDOD domain-containing protein [Nocardioides marmoribigeumensis]MDR7362666.1 HD-like signal output (HDOD) protein [Nocardioides marmoribigeumensis]
MERAAQAIDLLDLFSSAEAIDALPITVTRLAELVADDAHDFRDIAEVVSMDQSLTALLLRRANSVAMGGRTQITTVRDAAMRLGTGALLSMALASSVHNRMGGALPAYGLSAGELWKQSVSASLSTDVLRMKAKVTVPPEASTAALLHDFGKVVLSTHFGAQVLTMLEQAASSDGMDLLSAERAVFGVDHADIGGVVAQRWKLPHTIVDAIIHHHDIDPGMTPTVAAVSVAHAMVADVLHGQDDAPSAEDAPPAEDVAASHGVLLQALGIDPAGYPALLEAARARYVLMADKFGVD